MCCWERRHCFEPGYRKFNSVGFCGGITTIDEWSWIKNVPSLLCPNKCIFLLTAFFF